MNAWIIGSALGLLAAWPLIAVGSLVGVLAERMTRSPRVRETVWAVVFVLPLLFLIQVIVGPTLGHIFAAMSPTEPVAGNPQVTLLPSTFASSGLRSFFEALLSRRETLWIAVVVDCLSVVGLVARVSAWFAGRRRLTGVSRRASPLEPAGVAPVPMLVSAEIDRPMLAGLRRPVILIPQKAAQVLDGERLRLVALHECAHMRRGDNLRRPFEEALLGLFWLTPPLGLIRARMASATEEACDNVVLRDADPQVRRQYAQALIDTLRLGAGPEHAPAFIGADRRSRLMRMNAILNPAKPARPLTIAVLCGAGAALIAGAGFVAKTAAAEANASQATRAPASKPFVIANPDWIQRPNGVDLAAAFPAQALKAGVEGRTRMDCAVNKDGSLSRCHVTSETPADQGFGAAELKLAPKFRMQTKTADGHAVGGGVVSIPMRWQSMS